jgi:ribosomal protein L40E
LLLNLSAYIGIIDLGILNVGQSSDNEFIINELINLFDEKCALKDGDARTMLNMLQPFFKPRNRRGADAEQPSEKQIERDVRALLQGRKDGEILIKGKAKHRTAAEHTAVDDTHKPSAGAFKETVSGTFCTQCSTHNAEDAVFCRKCGTELKR